MSTTTATRYFPVGASADNAETAWRISWAFEPHPNKPGEQIWVITGVEFQPPGGVWIRVLDRLAVAAMFVPYVQGGSRFQDFVVYYTGIAQFDGSAATKRAYKPTFIHGKRIVRETTDDFVRWIESGPDGYHGVTRLRRGQAMVVWGLFSAVNYVYPVSFKFRDDGVIQVRIAASGQNLKNQPTNTNAHLHMGAWRAEFNLCAVGNAACRPEDVIVRTISRRVVSKPPPSTEKEERIVPADINGNSEGGVPWKASEYTALLVTNPSQPNGRPIQCSAGQIPPCTSKTPVGYVLVPMRHGSARFKRWAGEKFLDSEFWVTRKPVPPALAEIFFVEVHKYANGESLAGGRKVVWHKSSFNHIPRFEDLGIGKGAKFDRNRGIALISAYTGFDLVPRNLMHDTPLYTPKKKP